MAKTSASYACSKCGTTYIRWVGKCSNCGEFGTVQEAAPTAGRPGISVGVKGDVRAATVTHPARRVADINADPSHLARLQSGIGEFDRLIGGGFVRGMVILFGASPGFGKSTLALAVGNAVAATGRTVLYVSAEESAEQITLRANRIGATADTLLIADETDLAVVLGQIEATDPDLLIVDSLQTIASSDIEGAAGAVSQVNQVGTVLTRIAKARRMPLIIIAQMTKAGQIAGPNTVAHLCDCVAVGEGDQNSTLRLIRTEKNRFGELNTAAFEQTDLGMVEVPDPSSLFRSQRDEPVAGTCPTITMEGRRPIVAEIQALVAPTAAPNPRRAVSGLDSARMAMLIAVTERHGRIKLFDKDTYLATVAGLRVTEPAADLAGCLSLASAAWSTPLPSDVAAIGEVALSGDIRPVTAMAQRITEAARLGYTRVIVPAGTPKPAKAAVTLITVGHIRAALAAARGLALPAEEVLPPE